MGEIDREMLKMLVQQGTVISLCLCAFAPNNNNDDAARDEAQYFT